MSEQQKTGQNPIACSGEVLDLVERFERNREAYKSGQYNEMQLRQEFLAPFFEALGWDMTNKQGYAEAYKDVIHEDSIKVGADTKAPDYCFRIGGTRKFFLEAKKPSVYIKEDISPAFQLRRYAWSAKLPLSILTDFEEFAIYDTRIKPEKTDKASTARIHYFTFKDYLEKWDLISSVFSREAVLKGSFDKYAEKSRLKKGTATVDDAFLIEIEDWRSMLAKNIALRNSNLSQRELNFAVQRTIDRIVFLRICEDRGIEEYGRLQTQLNGTNVYKRLVQLFSQADDRYNSGLFHFQREKERHEEPDKLTPNITIDDKPLKDIINRLYYPESPYEFSVLSADILGQVYEQFLGKVIRLTEGHQAKVEDKPEVRKAGGVYYTPKYIVDYIVKNTVGTLLSPHSENAPSSPPFRKGGQGRFESSGVNPPQSPFAKGGSSITPKEASKLRILDPACGSGSFLLGAYQFLLDWHRDWYVKDDPKKWATSKNPTLYQAQGGDYHLTTAEKKRILLNNIYGVDIDTQAVEVTKLSLLLKVLEGENNQSLARQLKMFHERALPDLGDNIKCGNSLIGPDFYMSDLFSKNPPLKKGDKGGFDENEERLRINVFDWEKEFPEITKAGGFDAVIGNPPYGATLSQTEIAYMLQQFKFQAYQLDSYLLFAEKALTLVRKQGLVGVIIPNTWLLNLLSGQIRKHIFATSIIENIVHYRHPVFRDATVDTEITIFREGKPAVSHQINIAVVEKDKSSRTYNVSQARWQASNGEPVNIFEQPEMVHLVDKLKASSLLDDACVITQGAKPFQVGKGKPSQTRQIVDDKPFVAEKRKDKTFRPLLRGSLIQKYRVLWDNDYWISFGDWLAEPRYSAQYEAPSKIVIRQTGDSLVATLDHEQFIVRDNLYTLVPREHQCDLRFVLGLLNSRLLNWYYQTVINPEKGEALAQVKRGHLAKLPIVTISEKNNENIARHDAIVSLVDQMLSLNKQLPEVKTDHEKTALQRQIDATDRQIDQLVYELYGLTEGEMQIIEERAK